jgi:hypothetical protein
MKLGKEYLLDKIGGNKPDKYDEKTLELIAYWMDEYAKYYHKQQVNSVGLADVGGNEVALRNAAQKIVDITNNRQPEKYYDAFIELQEALKQ